jgi:hypothetical protein
MIILYTFIILFLIFLFYSINYYVSIKKIKNIELFSNNIKLNMGNYLVIYFYLMGKSFLEGNNFYYKHKNFDFIKDLPSKVKLNVDIRNKLIENNFTIDELVKEEKKIILVAMWTIINKRREQFWLIMKPQIHSILDKTLRKNNLYKKIDCPVIHFRCSDIPFIRNGYYFFQKYKFFKDSLNEIKKKLNINYKKVILLSCNFHKSTDLNSEKCNIYAESLKTYLENLGYIVDVKCSSNLEDFATIFYAPAIISTCSSFSFMSGFFSDGLFISEGHYASGSNIKCNDCGDWLKNGYSIEHHDVMDYYDTDSVIKMLKE